MKLEINKITKPAKKWETNKAYLFKKEDTGWLVLTFNFVESGEEDVVGVKIFKDGIIRPVIRKILDLDIKDGVYEVIDVTDQLKITIGEKKEDNQE